MEVSFVLIRKISLFAYIAKSKEVHIKLMHSEIERCLKKKKKE
jgi:hypothetical protein